MSIMTLHIQCCDAGGQNTFGDTHCLDTHRLHHNNSDQNTLRMQNVAAFILVAQHSTENTKIVISYDIQLFPW